MNEKQHEATRRTKTKEHNMKRYTEPKEIAKEFIFVGLMMTTAYSGAWLTIHLIRTFLSPS